MKKINRNQNMINANKTIQTIYNQNKQHLTENIEDTPIDYTPQPIGQEGIQKRIAELVRKKTSLENQKKQITLEIKKLNEEIKKWETEISPDQLTMFGDH